MTNQKKEMKNLEKLMRETTITPKNPAALDEYVEDGTYTNEKSLRHTPIKGKILKLDQNNIPTGVIEEAIKPAGLDELLQTRDAKLYAESDKVSEIEPGMTLDYKQAFAEFRIPTCSYIHEHNNKLTGHSGHLYKSYSNLTSGNKGALTAGSVSSGNSRNPNTHHGKRHMRVTDKNGELPHSPRSAVSLSLITNLKETMNYEEIVNHKNTKAFNNAGHDLSNTDKRTLAAETMQIYRNTHKQVLNHLNTNNPNQDVLDEIEELSPLPSAKPENQTSPILKAHEKIIKEKLDQVKSSKDYGQILKSTAPWFNR